MLPAAAPPLVVTTVTLRSAVLHGFPMAVLVGVAELAVVTAGDGTGVDWLGEDSEATCPLGGLWTDPHAAASRGLPTRAAAATACRAARADGVMDVPLIVALVPAVGLMLVLRLLDAHVAVLVATSGNRVRAARCFQSSRSGHAASGIVIHDPASAGGHLRHGGVHALARPPPLPGRASL